MAFSLRTPGRAHTRSPTSSSSSRPKVARQRKIENGNTTEQGTQSIQGLLNINSVYRIFDLRPSLVKVATLIFYHEIHVVIHRSSAVQMAPARPRGIDDSRSETSSSITNLKDRSLLGPSNTSAIAKGKRVHSSLHSGLFLDAKSLPNGASAPAPVDSESNVARVSL
jgi:hypothetical protein